MTLVKDVMTRSPISVRQDNSIDVAIDTMVEKNISGVPVVDDTGQLVGLITEFDVLQLYERPGSASENRYSTCRDFMTKEIRTIQQNASLEVAANIFRAASLRRLLVLDGNKFVGILSRRDVVRCIRDGRLQVVAGR